VVLRACGVYPDSKAGTPLNVASERQPFWTTANVPAVVVGAFLVGGLGLISAGWLHLSYCGGDGGSPYAAPGSPRGRFCEGGGAAAPLWLPYVGLMAIAPVLIAGALPDTRSGDDPAIPNDREYSSNYDCY
jgi:hypothetical protein